MQNIPIDSGFGTTAVRFGEHGFPDGSHVMPIYQTSTFSFPDVATGQAAFQEGSETYYYTRLGNPNSRHLASRLAALEGFDLLREEPGKKPKDIVAGEVFSSGMAALTGIVLSTTKPGGQVIVQSSLYGGSHGWFRNLSQRFGIEVIWLDSTAVMDWERAFNANWKATLAFCETPANPMLDIVDIAAVADVAHQAGAMLAIDNTFATPFCQRPLTLGADIVMHSMTKYTTGMGTCVGGAVISRHPDFVAGPLHSTFKTLGASPSPFDCWLTSLGLKTLELRMARHCENAMALAKHLTHHPAVSKVCYPGLPSHPGHEIADKQMSGFGGMISIELKGGFAAGVKLLESLKICTLAVSLGTLDTLVQHPAGMTHQGVPAEERKKIGISDGLVRISVGIENSSDLIADFNQALDQV
ncbi:MAG: aminotransferase class I/II-fold pyridoxal phosphate-dependent enzyme [Candidatus Wallbacteria bacterium]|nr:aminotransferase class I/II-fold pyridoxal phosphate-dependent enzyme [Candidatus Wallbacteria bacterium]